MAKKKTTELKCLPVIAYERERHCPAVLDSVAKNGTISHFCAENSISDTRFWQWCAMYPEFNDCYRIGLMKARYAWELEGELGKDDEGFHMIYWEKIGNIKFSINKADKIRIDVNPDLSPHEQYKQLITQASRGEFTSSEFKQISESINIGVRAYEVFKQQEEIDKLREDLNRMSEHHGEQYNSAD